MPRIPGVQPREATKGPKLTDLLRITEEEFRQRLKGSPVRRAKRRGPLRNVAAGLPATDDADALYALNALVADPDPLVTEQGET